jgi:hypothetical protein
MKNIQSRKSDIIQTHDFVVGALRDNVLGNNDRWTKQLEMKIIRLMKR